MVDSYCETPYYRYSSSYSCTKIKMRTQMTKVRGSGSCRLGRGAGRDRMHKGKALRTRPGARVAAQHVDDTVTDDTVDRHRPTHRRITILPWTRYENSYCIPYCKCPRRLNR